MRLSSFLQAPAAFFVCVAHTTSSSCHAFTVPESTTILTRTAVPGVRFNSKSAFSSGLFHERASILSSNYKTINPIIDSSLHASDSGINESPPVPADSLVADTSLGLKRVSWLSWWAQVILTTISAVILMFARNVAGGSVRDVNLNFVLPGLGILVSFASIFWTWGGGARLSRRLIRRKTSRVAAANMLRRAISVGVSLNLLGMTFTLLGAEQTVGYLAIKVMTGRPWSGAAVPMAFAAGDGLQPLDILVVQANTNSLFSHFASLLALLYLTRFVVKLDPPSQENKKRKIE